MNYCQSLEEIKEHEIEFVPETIISKVGELAPIMSAPEKVMVHILYNLCDKISITLPILWVARKINDEDFIASFYALGHHKDIFEMDEEEFETPHFEMNRMLYLKTLKYGYMWKDKSLPFGGG